MYEFPNKDIKEIQGRNNRSFNKCWINMIFICKKKKKRTSTILHTITNINPTKIKYSRLTQRTKEIKKKLCLPVKKKTD